MNTGWDRFGSRLMYDVAWKQELSRHRQVLPLYDKIPQIHDAWVAPNATLVGNVFLSKYSTIWYGVTMRAELNPIRVGHFSSIGDRSTLHTAHSLHHGLVASLNIGKNVSIGSNCNIHSCIIDDDVVIGENCII